MIAEKAKHEFVQPKCSRGKFGHHARRQASIGHSHRIHTPTRLQCTRKPATLVSPSSLPNQPNTTAHRRPRETAPQPTQTLVHTLCVCPTLMQLETLSKRTTCTGGGAVDRLYGSRNIHDAQVDRQAVPPVLPALRGTDPASPATAVG